MTEQRIPWVFPWLLRFPFWTAERRAALFFGVFGLVWLLLGLAVGKGWLF